MRRTKASFELRDDTTAFTCTVCVISSVVRRMWYSAFGLGLIDQRLKR